MVREVFSRKAHDESVIREGYVSPLTPDVHTPSCP
jgi:hypothetical protein